MIFRAITFIHATRHPRRRLVLTSASGELLSVASGVGRYTFKLIQEALFASDEVAGSLYLHSTVKESQELGKLE